MTCGNAIRAIRALRVDPQHISRISSSDARQVSVDDAEVADPEVATVTAEPEGFPSTATTSASANVSSTVSALVSEELLQAFPWLGEESNSEDNPDGEDIGEEEDDDDDFFTPAGRCHCEELPTFAKDSRAEADMKSLG
eukprot:TRINITY_DN50824_c0_g1_i1.p1 TRINITY_DN50824_c0_g1~~TRINITY_DN50824_c0_g1_i1.p1  ORF type:complete len:139 (-),score=32.40 TRINITY_DN50824_c0_g1_i1:248-664(-)